MSDRASTQEIAELYAAILAVARGEQVQAVGHKGRTASYSGADLEKMTKLYRMLWYSGCGSPELPTDLSASMATRGCFRVRFIG